MRPLERVLDALRHAGCKVKQSAHNQWCARCPGPVHRHGDQRPSLSITEMPDGRVKVHCFTGDRQDEILAALGLTWRDLRPANGGRPSSEMARRRPQSCSPLDEARGAVIREARGQPWARPAVLEMYARADWLRMRERLGERGRQRVTALGDCEEGWTLAEAAAHLVGELAALEATLDDALWTELLLPACMRINADRPRAGASDHTTVVEVV